MVSGDAYETANRRGREKVASVPKVISAHYDARTGRIVLHLSSKLIVSFSARDAQGLESGRPSSLREIEVSPSGLGLYFPKLDADLYVPALLEGFLGSRKWMASRLGEAGGRSRSAAKKAAARTNGTLGGRPRKAGRAQTP